MAGKFELFADAAGKIRWRLKAGNSEIIAQSQAYESKESAKRGIT
ncbi:YegP family protein [Nocardia salmonicida]